MTEPKTRVDIVFACGAMYRNVDGPFVSDAIARGSKPRRKDGLVSVCVYDSDTERPGTKPRRPTMPDGSAAPCRFGCPAKRASGRREQNYWPDETNSQAVREAVEDRSRVPRFPTYITCYPTERPTEFPEVTP